MQVMECRLVYEPRGAPFAVESLKNPELVVAYMRDALLDRPEQESIWVILLNRKNKPLGRHLVSLGSTSACLADAHSTFRAALLANATAIILVHNHPSGNPAPSMEDFNFTRTIRAASRTVGLEVLDHIILGRIEDDPLGRGWYSFNCSESPAAPVQESATKSVTEAPMRAAKLRREPRGVLRAAIAEARRLGIDPVTALRDAVAKSVGAAALPLP